MAIEVDQIYLSMQSADTGEYLTANVYTVDGVYEADGVTPRLLSIGQLVMAICLQRAAELEIDIVRKMSTLEKTTEELEDMTTIEQAILDDFAENTSGHPYYLDYITISSSKSAIQFLRDLEVINQTQAYVRNDAIQSTLDIMYDDFLTAIEAKMDEKNTFSQQTMIELQSQTTKRDQAYDMISNVLKTVNTALLGNANNL